MLDDERRRLERRAAETRSPFDVAKLLRAKARAGQLEITRLELAAHVACRAAELAVGAPSPRPQSWKELRRWGDRLSSFGWEGAFRAGLADAARSGRVVRAAWKSVPSSFVTLARSLEAHARLVASRLEALGAWLVDPSPARRREVARLAGDRRLDLPPVDPDALEEAQVDAEAITFACSQGLLITSVLSSHVRAKAPFVFGEWWPDEIEADEARAVRRIRAAVRRAVAPWALGSADPIVVPARDALDRIEIAAPCPSDWETMNPVEGDARVRWCQACGLNVYDLSALDRGEALSLLRAREGGRLCVRLYLRDDGRVLMRDCPSGLRATAGQVMNASYVVGGTWWTRGETAEEP